MNNTNMKSDINNMNVFKSKLIGEIWACYDLSRDVCTKIVDIAWNKQHSNGTQAVIDTAYELAETAEK